LQAGAAADTGAQINWQSIGRTTAIKTTGKRYYTAAAAAGYYDIVRHASTNSVAAG